MFTLRFVMRAPTWAAPIKDHYTSAVEMAAWAESRGAVVAVLSEHHSTADRHLPWPLILATELHGQGREVCPNRGPFPGRGTVASASAPSV